jgi:hypothetical protein
MPIQRIPFSIPPLNEQSTTSSAGGVLTGGFRFNGNPNVKFSIPAQPRMIDTSEMYLTGQIVIMDGATNAPLSLANAEANFGANNGANLIKNSNLNISPWAGVENVIERVMVQTKKSSVELMTHNNYPMYVNLKNGWTHNDEDYLISPLTRYLASGTKAGEVNRHEVTMPNATNNNAGVMSNLENFNDQNYGHFFSFKIDTSLLNNRKPLHLGQDQLGGLILTLELANPDGAFYRRFKTQDYAQQPDANVTGSFYILRNLKLEGRYIVPTPQELSQYQSQVGLNDRVNLINDVNSSVNSNTYTPNLGAVKSFVNLFIDDSQTNNIEENQSNFRTPLGLASYTQDKNSIRQPEDFVIKVQPNNSESVADNSPIPTANPIQLANPIGGVGDAEVRNRFQRAVLDGKLADHCSASLVVSNETMVEDNDTSAATADGHINNNKADLMGIGLDYTHGMGNMTNFKNQDYTLIVKSLVNSGNTRVTTNRNTKTELQQTYVRNAAMLDTGTLQKSQ